MAVIEFIGVNKSYDTKANVIKDLDLKVEKGEFVTLLGESGCGKTTLLKMINKLITGEEGQLIVKGKSIKDWDTVQLRRQIGYVIQQIGLFPHMTIGENITYVLSLNGTSKKICRRRAFELIGLIGLSPGYLDKYPRELSGGQRQRVGVARALAADPEIVLMDEPFGAVDERTRSQLQDDLLKLHNELHKTILFVTHDIHEALKLGTKIVLMNRGKVEQMGTREDLIFNPENDFVREFFGSKGFTAILDEKLLHELYQKVLNREITMENIYSRLTQ
ncbi:MAG: glycine/betaine ABC transporter ATP-binding protein [delta proteobacterium ML8_F1]|nr:MAG: glycine/betaine ABC transporter ATP-binding protein [delta proteobacterium ML8_F1]